MRTAEVAERSGRGASSACAWYALRVAVRHEKAAERRLSELGYETLLPTYKSRRIWSDRIKTLKLPLFPGYMFCKLDLNQPVKAYMAPRVLGVVRCGAGGAEISEEQIDAIRRFSEYGRGVEPWLGLAVGAEVEVASGPMAGCRGRLAEVRGKQRLVVEVAHIRRSFCVEVGRGDVRPVRISGGARSG